MFYLNAIYKKDFQCSDEEAEEYAKKFKEYVTVQPLQNDGNIEYYIKTNNGLWRKDSINRVFTTVGTAGLDGYMSDYTKTIYINFEPIFTKIKNDYFEEIGQPTEESDDEGNILETTDNSNKSNEYKVYDIYLDSIYNDFMEDTIQIAKSLDISKTLLENGIENVYKFKKLFNYTSFYKFCENQKQVIKTTGLTLGESSYLTNWIIHRVTGPKRKYYDTNFKTLKQNAYKPNLDIEIKKLEEDVENGGKCPKYLKTYTTFKLAVDAAYGLLTQDEYNGPIKNAYIGLRTVYG